MRAYLITDNSIETGKITEALPYLRVAKVLSGYTVHFESVDKPQIKVIENDVECKPGDIVIVEIMDDSTARIIYHWQLMT